MHAYDKRSFDIKKEVLITNGSQLVGTKTRAELYMPILDLDSPSLKPLMPIGRSNANCNHHVVVVGRAY